MADPISRVLIRAVNNPNEPTNPLVHQKGDLVAIIPGDRLPGSKETLPNFIWVNITNGNFNTHRTYWESWLSKLNWSRQSLNTSEDLWRVTLEMENVPPSNRGGLTKTNVDAKLADWNITTTQFAPNTVRFDTKVYDVGRSSAVLGGTNQNALDQITWSETLYNETTGVHVINGDYSLTAFTAEQVNDALNEVEVISHNETTKVFEYEVTRTGLFENFQFWAEEVLENRLGKNRYKISESDVDTIVGLGGTIDRTQAQFLAALIDKIATET